ncbi:MAG: tyrosine-type recombinase/integrase, partial [Candidatus Margulisbacteria bacterium]|nr:tyrosine-type recombinase/integrase [Candidatus Margulisiibacteriota bacterium]
MARENPFTIFKRGGRRFLYVQFKDKDGGYLPQQYSTGQTGEAEAIKTAWEWYLHGVPTRNAQRQEKIKMTTAKAVKTIKADTLDRAEARQIIMALQRNGHIKSAIFTGDRRDRDFIGYLLEFWDWEKSPYIKEKLRCEHTIHRQYCDMCRIRIKKLWEPHFSGKLLGEITREDIEAFITDVIDPADMANRTKNLYIKCGAVALRYAYKKDLIAQDITKGIVLFSEKPQERHILSPEQARQLFGIEWKNETVKLANMLAAFTGMRAGEILGLRLADIGDNCIYVRHSWNNYQRELKPTKTNEARTVYLPFPQLLDALRRQAALNPYGEGLDGFVFFCERKSGRPEPMDETILLAHLRKGLEKIGVTDRQIVFHSWRHFYSAYMKDRINDKLLQSQTGHKTLTMLKHYSGHEISGDMERIQQASLEAFGGLLPEN